MPQSRKSQISLAATPYYHCISRCVRRAYLCGQDEVSGRSYEHRRGWVEEKLLSLTQAFAIEVCAYAIMSNHTHLVVYVGEQVAESWSVYDILFRWHKVFKGTYLTQAYMQGAQLTEVEYQTVKETAQIYKLRLCSISWFMRALNEHIARKANQEDECTGRFWEGRFKSQPLLDEPALLACMAYVDLNPVRAGIAKSPETSGYTSIRQRIKALLKNEQPKWLRSFKDEKANEHTLDFALTDYLELVDMTSRVLIKEKQAIPTTFPSLLARMNISLENWLTMSQHFTTVFHGALGSITSLNRYCEYQNKKRRRNLSACQQLFS